MAGSAQQRTVLPTSSFWCLCVLQLAQSAATGTVSVNWFGISWIWDKLILLCILLTTWTYRPDLWSHSDFSKEVSSTIDLEERRNDVVGWMKGFSFISYTTPVSYPRDCKKCRGLNYPHSATKLPMPTPWKSRIFITSLPQARYSILRTTVCANSEHKTRKLLLNIANIHRWNVTIWIIAIHEENRAYGL